MVFCESFINEPISMFDNDSTETSPDMTRVKPFRETPFFVNSSAYHSDKSLGYICRGDAAYSVELHDDTLLAGDASDTSLDARKSPSVMMTRSPFLKWHCERSTKRM